MLQERSFIHRAVWLFTAGCMAGFLMESMESLVNLGYVQNRQGLLYGPFTPVYGAGVLLFALCAPILKKRPWPVVFAFTALAGSALEYLWSWGQEQMFGVIFWDYRHLPLNLDGRVNLLFSLYWGALGVFFLKGACQPFCNFVAGIPRLGRGLVTWVLILLLMGDATISAGALFRQRARQYAKAATSQVELLLDEVYPDERLKEQFPTMQSTDR